MSVSAHDRDYMRRLGEFEAEGARERTRAHLDLPFAERIQRGVELCRCFLASANLASREDDPTPFYDRARRLGLYRP